MSKSNVQPTETTSGSQWWHFGTIYQVYPHSFADGNKDGVGDLKGILSRVDHLQWLGVDAVWLSPVYESPQRDNGYDVSDYRKIEPKFGTMADLDSLIDELHSRKIRLIMDLVVNHTSSKHAWFQEACSSRDNPFRDWYIWRDAKPGTVGGEPGSEPNNWGSYFSESAWTWHAPTQQYYLHLYAKEQPDLNWDHPPTRAAIYEMMGWWLDKGVDGFRMDVINLISKPTQFVDAAVFPGAAHADPSSTVRFGPRLLEHLAEMHREVFQSRSQDIIRIGETPGLTLEQARELTHSRECGLDMVFQFEHMELDRVPGDRLAPIELSIPLLRKNLASWQSGLFGRGWNSLYGNNHDQPRLVSRFGDPSPEHWAKSAKAIPTALYLLQGTVSMYQGEEIGMIGATLESEEDFLDIRSVSYIRAAKASGRKSSQVLEELRKTARDNARSPMHWNHKENAGFSSTRPWMPVAKHSPEITVSQQLEDKDSILHYYRHLIRLRKEHPVIASGEPVIIDTGDNPVMAYLRKSESQNLLVVANLSSDRLVMPKSLAQLLQGKPKTIIESFKFSDWDCLEGWQAFACYLDQENGGVS